MIKVGGEMYTVRTEDNTLNVYTMLKNVYINTHKNKHLVSKLI